MKDIIKIINAYYNNKIIELNDDVINLAINHTLQSYLFYVTNDSKYKKYVVQGIKTNELYDNLKKEVDDLLKDINHFYFKGIILKNYYDEPFLRKMGDIDFIVDKSDFTKALKILKDNGFVADSDQCEHHVGLFKDGLEIELHQSLFDTYHKRYEYFLDFKKHIEDDHFEINYHYVYVICHFESHIKEGGAGLRPLIDLYLLRKYINLDIVNKYLKELNLIKFHEVINNLIDYIFDEKELIYEDFLEFLIKSGIHGFNEDNNFTEIKYSNVDNKFLYLLKKTFPSISSMKAIYPILNKWIILLPICYIRRFFFLIFKRRGKAKDLINSNKDNNYIKLLNEIGLK